MTRVHYPNGFLGAPVLELPAETMASVFSEMDTVAAKLRVHPQFVPQDLQIAFCKLQRERIGNLSRDDWLWLFEIWCDRDRGLRAARLARLCKQREGLFAERAVAPSQHRAALTARLAEIGVSLPSFKSDLNHPVLARGPLAQRGWKRRSRWRRIAPFALVGCFLHFTTGIWQLHPIV